MLPRVHRVRSGGRVFCYHRGTRARLPDLPEDHPEFIAAWAMQEAATTRTRATPGTLAHLIESTRRAPSFAALSPGYRKPMIRHFEALRTAYGTAPAGGLKPRHVKADLAKLPAIQANSRLRAWRLIARHAVEAALVPEDFTAGIHKRAEAIDGHAPWSADQIARFRARWPVGTPARGAFELLLWTGARTGDAVRMSRAQIGSDGVLSFRQAKTGHPAHVPWTSPLPAWARHWAAERDTMRAAVEAIAPGGFTWLEAAGRVRSVKGLGNLISRAAAGAGIEGRSAHGLRKTRLTLIAEAGGPTQALMAWSGHKTLAEAEHYTRSAARKALVIGEEQAGNAVKPAV